MKPPRSIGAGERSAQQRYAEAGCYSSAADRSANNEAIQFIENFDKVGTMALSASQSRPWSRLIQNPDPDMLGSHAPN
jgi:hypothetical protein